MAKFFLKSIVYLSVFTGLIIFGSRVILHFSLPFLIEKELASYQISVEKIDEEVSLWSDSFTLDVVIPNDEKRYSLKTTLETKWEELIPLMIHMNFQGPGIKSKMPSVELNSFINFKAQIKSSLKIGFVNSVKSSYELYLKKIEIENLFEIEQKHFEKWPAWGDLLLSDFKIKIEQLDGAWLDKKIHLNQLELQLSPFDSSSRSIDFISKASKSKWEFNDKRIYEIDNLVLKQKIGLLDENQLTRITDSFVLSKLFLDKLVYTLDLQLQTKSEGKNLLSIKFASTKDKDFVQTLNNGLLNFKAQLHRRWAEDVLSAILYAKFKALNTTLFVEQDGKKPEEKMKSAFHFFSQQSPKIIDILISEKYLEKNQSELKFEGEMKEFQLSFNNKVLSQKIFSKFISTIDSSLLKKDFTKFNFELIPLIKAPDVIKVKAKQIATQETAPIEKLQNEVDETQEEKSQSKPVIVEGKELRQFKVIAKKNKKQVKVFKNNHIGIWYDKNRPNVKFHLFRGKNGIFYGEQIVLDKKGKVTPRQKFLFHKDGKYKIHFEDFKVDYTVSPIENSKISYSFDNYSGFLIRDNTRKGKIVKKYFELRAQSQLK